MEALNRSGFKGERFGFSVRSVLSKEEQMDLPSNLIVKNYRKKRRNLGVNHLSISAHVRRIFKNFKDHNHINRVLVQ